MAKRRIDAAENQVKRVQVEADWVDMRTTMSLESFYACQDPANVYDKQVMLCQQLICAWSFVGEDGEPLPCTDKNIADNMDAEIMFDVVAEINQLPFLRRMLERANQNS